MMKMTFLTIAFKNIMKMTLGYFIMVIIAFKIMMKMTSESNPVKIANQ